MAEYNSTSKKAEEFINDEKIKSTLAFAQEHKDDLELMNEILEKGREYKGLSYAEAATLLECEDPPLGLYYKGTLSPEEVFGSFGARCFGKSIRPVWEE